MGIFPILGVLSNIRRRPSLRLNEREIRVLAEGPFVREARQLGKRERTRARLMDAAVSVFAREGFEAASVNEIARAADVVNGTFYVHFKDKDDLIAQVAVRIAGDVAGQLDEAMSQIEDAVERVALATRRFIDLACSRPEWGWALLRAVWALPALHHRAVAFLRADLERGVRQGAFTIQIDGPTIDIFGAMIMAALAGRLRGAQGPEAGSRVAELQLRMLGVAAETARAVAWRPIEPLALRVDERSRGPRERAFPA